MTIALPLYFTVITEPKLPLPITSLSDSLFQLNSWIEVLNNFGLLSLRFESKLGRGKDIFLALQSHRVIFPNEHQEQ